MSRKISKTELWKNNIEFELGKNINYPKYGNNKINTSKYNPITFIPLNFFHQFSKIANFYFLLLVILQFIKPISITNGVPTILPTLIVIIGISMFKDFLEDYKRWKQDSKENNSMVKKFQDEDFKNVQKKSILLGDIIMLEDNETIPADILVIESSDKQKGLCYLETKNLDGETNLNEKNVHIKIREMYQIEQDYQFKNLLNQKVLFNYEPANSHIHNFNGSLKIQDQQQIALTNDNIMLRGCTLRNTDWVIGVVIYNGHYSKIMMNTVSTKEKKSMLEKKMNKYIIFVFSFLIFFCMLSSILYMIWFKMKAKTHLYLETGDENAALIFFLRFGNWILIFGNFVPISLIVTVETVKYLQAQILMKNKTMIDSKGFQCQVNSSNLNEELGQIQYVFSDKTGTLTQNLMIFKCLIVGSDLYQNEISDQILQNEYIQNDVTNVDFDNNKFFNSCLTSQQIQDVMIFLSLCHTVTKYKGKYGASSPDELAIVNFSKKCGFEFLEKDGDDNLIIKMLGQERRFKLLYTLQFTSDRKRMSVIVKDEQNSQYLLLTKGADNIILKRSKNQLQNGNMNELVNKVDQLSKIGLRTLLLAKKILSTKELEDFQIKMDQANNDVKNREEKVNKCYEELEQDLEIIGATALEDKLQDQVPETIEFIRRAGIKVWVLTGDKVETAKNIGLSANLLQDDMIILDLLEKEKNLLGKRLNQIQQIISNNTSYRKELQKSIAIVVQGESLLIINSCKNLQNLFVELTLQCESVLCCRVSPKQKREIVDLVAKNLKGIRTLAIGDGANDVNMIVGANVGIGIQGVEGCQAARQADYAIGEFRFLKNLLFQFGREYYRKNSIMVLYNFWKNIVLVLPQFFYALLYNNFSGVTLYEGFLYQFVNLFYTSLPIIIYCLFDQELTPKILLTDPQYYYQGIKNIYFNVNVFFVWYSQGIIQAFFIAFIASLATQYPQKNGQNFGFWGYGIFVFMLTQLVCNLKILIFSNSFNFWIYFFVFGGFLLFIISFVIVSAIQKNVHYRLIETIFNSPITYVTTIIVIALCTFLDSLWELAQKILLFKYINLVVPRQKTKNQVINANKIKKNQIEQQDSNIVIKNIQEQKQNHGDRIPLIDKTQSEEKLLDEIDEGIPNDLIKKLDSEIKFNQTRYKQFQRIQLFLILKFIFNYSTLYTWIYLKIYLLNQILITTKNQNLLIFVLDVTNLKMKNYKNFVINIKQKQLRILRILQSKK